MPARTFTVMCQDISGSGTIWIDTVEIETDPIGSYQLEAIKKAAVEKCAHEWERDEDDDPNILCMGVALGPVNFLYFDDSHLGT